MMYVQVYIQLDDETPFDIRQQDVYRDRLYHHLKQTYDYLSLDVIYTAQPIWVMRSIGETALTPRNRKLTRPGRKPSPKRSPACRILSPRN